MAFKLLLLLFLLLAGLNTIPGTAASPTGTRNNQTHLLHARQCKWSEDYQGYWDCDHYLPSIAELVEHIRDTSNDGRADAEHSVIFYTNLDDDNLAPMRNPNNAWMHGWLRKENIEYYWTGQALSRKWMNDQTTWLVTKRFDIWQIYGKINPVGFLQNCYYQALGVAALNPDAYLFTKKDTDWKPTSVWAKVEYPALTRNSNIQRIWRVDPRPPDVTGVTPEEACEYDKKELLWERGRDAEVDMVFDCDRYLSKAMEIESARRSSTMTTTTSDGPESAATSRT